MKRKRKIDPKTGKGTASMLPYVAELCEYKRRSRKSWRKIAEEMEVPNPYVIKYRDGTYAGDIGKMTARVRDYLHGVNQRGHSLSIPFVETSVSKAVQEICAFAQLEGTIGLVYGPAGIGKTVALEDYCRRTDHAYLVTCSPAVRTPHALVREIIYAITESRGSKTMPENVRFVIEELYGTEGAIILDEAQHLRYDALEEARAVHDATRCAFVFCGTMPLRNKLIEHAGAILEQLFSRVGCQRYISDEVPQEDVVAVVEAALGKLATPKIKKYLVERAEFGGLRIVTRQLKNAAQMARLAGEELSLEHVKEAEKLLML